MCIHVRGCVYTCMCVSVCAYMCVGMCMQCILCMHEHVYLSTGVCGCVCMHERTIMYAGCVCVNKYVYLCVCMHMREGMCIHVRGCV